MEIHKDKQETFTIVVSRDELIEIKDAIGLRCLYFDSLNRKKASIARSKSVSDDGEMVQNDKSFVEDKIRSMYGEMVKGLK